MCDSPRILLGARARPGTLAPVTKPLLYRLPHLTLRMAPVGSPSADGETEAEQQLNWLKFTQPVNGARVSDPFSFGTETPFWKWGTLELS